MYSMFGQNLPGYVAGAYTSLGAEFLPPVECDLVLDLGWPQGDLVVAAGPVAETAECVLIGGSFARAPQSSLDDHGWPRRRVQTPRWLRTKTNRTYQTKCYTF